jgi:hypothetical protein
MSTFLGIAYNKWHGIFGALIQIVGITTSFWWLKTDLLQVQMYAAITISTFINLLLQSMNEAFQFLDENIVKNYGSLENAQANSRDDWKWWLLGLIGGSFLGVIIFVVIDKIIL